MKHGIYLKNLREERGLSLRDVQHKTGISNSLLSQIERGMRQLTHKTAGSLAELYGVPPIELMNAHSGGTGSRRKGAAFDYEQAYREIVKKYIRDTSGFADQTFDEIPSPLKKLLVQLEAKATGRKAEEPRFNFSIRHSTGDASTEFSVPDLKLKGAMLVRASVAAECMEVLRSIFGAVYALNGKQPIKELSDQDFVESHGLKPVLVNEGVPYYDLARVLDEIAKFTQTLQKSYGVAEPEMPERFKRFRR